jgi:YfiR/HmsC-like
MAATNTARAEDLPEYTLKAAYLYNFAILTEWPPGQAGTGAINYCFYRGHQLEPAIEILRTKTIQNRPVVIRYVSELEQVQGCQVLVFGQLNRYATHKLMDYVAQQPILTISDAQLSVTEADAMISIVPDQQHLTFEVNLLAAKQANINLSARLLRVAKKVLQ